MLSEAARPIVEALERRQLLSSQVNFDFGPRTADTMAGTERENGSAFADQGYGYEHGFSSDISAGATDRNSSGTFVTDDVRYHSFVQTQYLGGNYSWEVELPNGTYNVRIVAGDSSNFAGHYYHFLAEGTAVVNAAPNSLNRYKEGTASINVSDGELTITNGGSAANNKICFIEITPSGGTLAAPSDVTVTDNWADWPDVRWRDNSDGETAFEVQYLESGTWSTYRTTKANATTASLDLAIPAPSDIEALRVRSTDGTNNSAWSNVVTLIDSPASSQAPYGDRQWKIGGAGSGVIEAENFDTGGSGTSWSDAQGGNAGGYYRNSDVDVTRVLDSDWNVLGYKVMSFGSTEWIEYTVDVEAAGDYRLEMRVASVGGGPTFHVEFGGVDETGSLTVTNTSGWQDYTTLTDTVDIAAGSQVMRIDGDSGSGTADIDWIRLVPLEGQAVPPDAPAPGGGGSAAGTGDGAFTGTSESGMRFFDGAAQHETQDLLSQGFGMPWGHVRGWTNKDGYVSDIPNGNGWVIQQMPSMKQVDGNNIVAVITDSTSAGYFDLVSSAYVARHDDLRTLTHDSGAKTFTVTDRRGRKWTFHDFDASFPAAKKGGFLSYTDPDGNDTEVISRNGDGRITEVQRTDASNVTESFVYGYYASGDHEDYLEQITWRRQYSSGGPWETIRTSHYAYYGSSDANGSFHDLKTATIKDAGSNVIDTWYYRYYTNDADGKGYAGALKFVVGPAGYERADAAIGGGILASSDANLEAYADQYYEYDGSKRIRTHVRQGEGCSVCAGGLGEFTYEYSESLHADGRANWRYKTIENRPDGSRRIVYANVYGQTLLSVEQPTGSAAGGEWLTFYEYDSDGRLKTIAHPSAVTGYDESLDDLVGDVSGDWTYVANSTGLVETRAYYASTTATSGTAGGVDGFLDTTNLHRGESGTAVPQSKSKYKSKTIGSNVIYPLAESTVYRNDNGTGDITTLYSYTYYGDDTGGTSADDTLQVRSLTVTKPVVTTGQNGPGGATGDQEITVYDEYGRQIWARDGGGYLTKTVYDNASGGVSTQIIDYDETTTAPPSEVNTGLASDNGLHLDHVWVLDDLGRSTKYTDPAGNITFTVYDDADQEVRTYTGWDSTLFSSSGGPTGPTTVRRLDRAGGYAETLTMSAQPNVSSGEPTGGESISSVESLSRTGYNEAWQAVTEDAYFNLSGLSYSTSASLGTENTHFYRTETRYDKLGRMNRVLDPTDTIKRIEYDGLGRVSSTWVGLDDTPTSGFWSTSNLTGTDMLSTASYVYDGGGVADGNLTKLTKHVDATSGNDRVSLYEYDWRNRLMVTRNGATFSGANATPIEFLYTTYDNLNQPLTQERFHSSTSATAWSYTSGVPNSPTSGDRTHKSAASYDEQGRVWRQETFSVNTSSGAVGSSLKTDRWYDRRGNVIKTSSPGGLVTKNTFDGAGRQKTTYVSDGGSDTAWTDADDVTSDVVVEERQYNYDGAGSMLLVTSKQRFHNASGTGALGDSSTSPTTRRTYGAFFYDKANRLTASVNVGTNAASSYSRPGSAPSRSDTVLVTSYTYDSAGNPFTTTDPRGIESRSSYDDLGRRTSLVEGYVNGTPSDDDDRTTLWAYDGNGNVTSMTADLPGTDQTTTYSHAARTSRGDALNSNTVLISTDYPDVGGGVENTESYKTNRAGERTSWTDRNGSVHAYTYDLLGRLTLDDVTTLGSGVDGTVRKLETSYNDAGLPLLLTSKSSGGTVLNQIQRTYNGLGQLTSEEQEHSGAVDGSTLSVDYAYSEMAGGANHSRLTSMTYPDGNVLAYTYSSGLDSTISRLSKMTWDGTDVESYAYLGLSTVVERDRPEADHTLTYLKQGVEGNGDAGDQYAGLDRFGRIVDQRWILDAGGHADRFTYGHDRSGNRLWRKNELSSTHSELYMADAADEQAAYDKLDRLVEFQRGTLSDAVGSDGYYDTVSTSSRRQQWDLDALGNWDSLTNDGGSAQTRTHDVQNRIASVSGATSPVHSPNGEMTTDETGQALKYDAWGRIIEVNTDGTGAVEITYGYDALFRRIARNTNEFYYSAEWQQIEERDTTGVEAQFVWSPVYVDAMVLKDRDSDNDGVMEATDERLYVVHDANFNVTAVLDDTGTVVERYIYDAYGTRSVLDANWAADSDGLSDYGFEHGHQGGRHDLAAGLVHFRNRDLDTSLGRWTRQDPLGHVDGLGLYVFVASSPLVGLDPTGFAIARVCAAGAPGCGQDAVLNQPSTPERTSRRECCDTAAEIYHPMTPESEYMRAGWFCCNEEYVMCYFKPFVFGSDYKPSWDIIYDCVMVHEADHEADHYPTGCKGRGDGLHANYVGSHHDTECSAYQAEFACLSLGLIRCGSDVECIRRVWGRMRTVLNQILRYCGGFGDQ